MNKNRTFFSVFVLIALIGIANCVLIEPAFACHSNVAKCAKEATPSCSMCMPGHHQWIVFQDGNAGNEQPYVSIYRRFALSVNIDPPLGSIFHPPTHF
jgi:hypothetical protein